MSIRMRLAGASAAILMALAPLPGWAIDSCSGTYSATLLRPLPSPLVVGLVIQDDSPRNIDLAARFNAGLQKAGIAVTGAANVQLTLRVTLSNDASLGDAAPVPSSDSSSSWWNGGANLQLPGQSRFGGNRQSPALVTVRLRAEIRRSPTEPVAWVGTLRCAMQGSDEQQLAYDIGTVIGGAIGQRADQISF